MKRAILLVIISSLIFTYASTINVANAQNETPYFNAVYEVSLSQHYSVFGTIQHSVNLQLTGHIIPFNATNLKLTILYSFTLTGISGLPAGANHTASQGFYGVNKLVITFPAGLEDFNIVIRGMLSDPSILYRNVADIPSVSISSNGLPFIPSPFGVIVPQSPAIQIYSVDPSPGPKSVSGVVIINGNPYYSIEFPGNARYVELLYQQPYRDYFVFLYLIAFAVSFPLLIYLYRNSRTLLARYFRPTRSRLGSMALRSRFFKFPRMRFSLRPFDSKKWLGLFVLSAILMLSFAFIFGPSPTPRAYLASTPTTTPAISPYIKAANWTYMTPLQVTGTDKFDTMSTLGAFDAIILADYPPPLDTEGLTSAYHIIVLTQYMNKNQTLTLQQLYPDYRLTFVNNVTKLTNVLNTIHPRTNPLGISTPYYIYLPVVIFEGVMSFVIVFFALGFFSSAVVEGSRRGLSSIAVAVAYSVLVFLFTQMIYIVTTVFLGIPVGLHASTSHDTTAVGMLGFGGGTRPRMLSGALGFLAGVLLTKEARVKLDYAGFFAFVAAGIFVLIDPANLGNLFSQLILVNVSGVPTSGAGGQTYEGVRNIIGTFMNLFGDNVTVNYYSQHGAAAFFAGAVPFALYHKLGKSTSTFLALFCAYLSGTGFVRIADMIPLKAIASVVPGVALGGVIILLFIAVGLVEAIIRKKLVNR